MFPLNLPNVLTVLRIMLVPVVVVALLGNTPAGDVLAAVVFALASLTDFVDGRLARARGSITTFGKLMDPLADKLLIVAALLSLVSLGRLEAWVAMVIITRELAVTVLRLGATQAGVVIGASMFGKVKTCMQIAAILALIAVHGEPLWVSLLLYATVRRDRALRAWTSSSACAAACSRRRSARRAQAASELPRGEPLLEASSDARPARPSSISARSSESRPWRSATTLCWWIVSRFSWRAVTKLAPSSSGKRARHAGEHLAHAVLDEARAGMRLSTTSTSSARFISS